MPRHVHNLLAIALLAGSTGIAPAQNALGDGRALDNSLNIRDRYNRARPNLSSEISFRNAVVTGNAPSGLSFRGDVGYRAPGEFRGDLGSNDLFPFRRDTLRSGIAGMGIRGTEALQYQLSLTTGARPPSNIVGNYTVTRAGSPTAGDIRRGRRPGETRFDDDAYDPFDESGALRQRPALDPEADDRGTMLWMLRSPSAYMSNNSLQTSALTNVRTETGRYTLTASPLRGVRLSPLPELVDPDTTPRRDDAGRARPGQVPADQRDEDRAEEADRPGAVDRLDNESPTGPVSTLHTDMIDRLREQDRRRREDVFATGPGIGERVRKLIEKLRAPPEESEEEQEQPADPTRPVDEEEAREREIRERVTKPLKFDPETIRLLRGDGEPLTEYVDPEAAGRDVFAEHLLAGQKLMARERYFDAEERFAHALAIRPGNVTAQIGRLHAQLGAGLFISASLNMQSLALSRPEIFAARYGEELLPSGERIEDVIIVLGNTIDPEHQRSRMASPQMRQAAGLLLAYLGYQTDRPELVREGVEDFREQVGDDADSIEARIGEFFRALWIEGEPPEEALPDAGNADD